MRSLIRTWGVKIAAATGFITVCLAAAAMHGAWADSKGASEAAPPVAKAPDKAAPVLPSWMTRSMREMVAKRVGRVAGPDFTKQFSKNVARIKMRDGAELHTEIYAPLGQTGS